MEEIELYDNTDENFGDISELVFSAERMIKQLNQVMRPPISTRFRKEARWRTNGPSCRV